MHCVRSSYLNLRNRNNLPRQWLFLLWVDVYKRQFLERAIVGERLRLAMGLPCRNASEHAPVSDNIEAADRAETYYTPPLINVIKFACNACKEKRVHVTDGCQGCLAHPCVEVCPKGAVTLDRTTGRSPIDEDKCIKCGKCATVCSYNAIIVQQRPCAAACGMDAISSDENGKADIDYDKCVSCGPVSYTHLDVYKRQS